MDLRALQADLDALAMTRPAMAFYPGDELEGDATNWCGPNPEAVAAMLTVAGFTEVRPVSYYLYEHATKTSVWEPVSTVDALRRVIDARPGPPGEGMTLRAVFHAVK